MPASTISSLSERERERKRKRKREREREKEREKEKARERERERERNTHTQRDRERERALLGIIHNGGSRASPAYGLRITILTGLLDRVAFLWQRRSLDSDERLAADGVSIRDPTDGEMDEVEQLLNKVFCSK